MTSEWQSSLLDDCLESDDDISLSRPGIPSLASNADSHLHSRIPASISQAEDDEADYYADDALLDIGLIDEGSTTFQSNPFTLARHAAAIRSLRPAPINAAEKSDTAATAQNAAIAQTAAQKKTSENPLKKAFKRQAEQQIVKDALKKQIRSEKKLKSKKRERVLPQSEREETLATLHRSPIPSRPASVPMVKISPSEYDQIDASDDRNEKSFEIPSSPSEPNSNYSKSANHDQLHQRKMIPAPAYSKRAPDTPIKPSAYFHYQPHQISISPSNLSSDSNTQEWTTLKSSKPSPNRYVGSEASKMITGIRASQKFSLPGVGIQSLSEKKKFRPETSYESYKFVVSAKREGGFKFKSGNKSLIPLDAQRYKSEFATIEEKVEEMVWQEEEKAKEPMMLDPRLEAKRYRPSASMVKPFGHL